ncbi:MAG TPA: alpha/beta fold hydrolase [Solirubrobacteraceae bacterium]|jgi:pimeloyl-ACP methyl ester carboxylesterase|nr:alpha/beta fold hydrolase [Solirubrobacteraceae bacterium]
MGRKHVFLLVSAICATIAAAAPAAAGARFTVRSLTVPLEHARPDGPSIELRYARFPARGPARGTIVFLAGGPGEPAVESADLLADEGLRGVRPTHDVVVVDQRGAGRSSRLRCPSLRDLDSASAREARAAIAACGASLGERRAFFSTYETVLDLEDLRRALGVPRIIPFGVSYGGQLAAEYARRFPERTQAVVLDSASPSEGIDALARLPQVALPRVLRELCAFPGCVRILGDPRVTLARAVELLDRRPLRGIGPQELYELVRASDGDALIRAELPAVLQAATRRDAAPLVRLVRYANAFGTDVDMARYLATTCTEGQLPWAPDSDPAGRPALLARALQADAARYAPFPVEAVAPSLPATLCLAWPATARPPIPPAPETGPDVPVLVLAGREDLRTPLEDQQRTAARFPGAQVLARRGVGHAVFFEDWTACSIRALMRFLDGRALPACPGRGTPYDVALPAFRSLRAVPRPEGDVPARIGRTAVAVDLTLRDAERWALQGGLPAAGLRGGRIEGTADVNRLRLVRYEVVPGVRVSGVLRRGPDTLRVTGSGATGTLRVAGGRLRGVLDGRRIAYRPLAPRPAGATGAAALR